MQSKYLLTHQEQDVKGRTKTRLYKGDILETRGGGHQVRFTGVESLRDGNMSTTSQESNGTTRPRCEQGEEHDNGCWGVLGSCQVYIRINLCPW